MSQSVNLSISGLYTALSDFQGLPQGALDSADNAEIRYRNVLEPRRGFDSIVNSSITPYHFLRQINFWVNGSDSLIGLGSDGVFYYYNGAQWLALPGLYSVALSSPDTTDAKSRFVKAGQNLYLTTTLGIISLSSGSGAQTQRAGVPKGLDLSAATNGDASGFFTNNTVLQTTGTTTNTSANLTLLASTTGVAVGNYVSGTGIPAGTKVSSITASATVLVETANLTAGNTTISNLTSIAGLVAGVIVSGTGIASGTTIVSTAGAGPYTAVLSVAPYQTGTGVTLSFASSPVIAMNQNATSTNVATTLTFYAGAQVGYRMVFGRVETDVLGNTLTRLGSPSSIALASNILGTSTNTTVTGTIPKNSSTEIEFVQLYRSVQTAGVSVTPLDQYQLVSERDLTPTDFANRVITITDTVPDTLKGIPLYAGSDQEGLGQANDPPPLAWDMCIFRDFTLFANITKPSTLQFSVTAVGPANGVQIGDVISITGTLLGVAFSKGYTGAVAENAAARQFKIVTTGTSSQNITDTVNSLIRVINYDEAVPVHAILLSTSVDLPGKVLLEADNPTGELFTVTTANHPTAYDPTLTNVPSLKNWVNNGIAVSKTGELEAVPADNLLYAGDSSSNVLRVIALRDYVIVIKTDGIYKIQGLAPNQLVISPFDLTTKIIGADTAVSLNSSVWMLSTQGVVSISDGGVEAKSVPIDDQINAIIGSYQTNVQQNGFAIGYESDRKYILCLPKTSDVFAEIEFCFNYVTNAWTTWSRNFYSGFVHTNQNKLYVARADPSDLSTSVERKSNTYKDYVDEPLSNTIVSVATSVITLLNVDNVTAGDILYQSSTVFSPILSVDLIALTVTVQFPVAFTAGAVTILKAYPTTVAWKQFFGDNPAFLRQFSEGIVLFKNTQFNSATISFVTDFSKNQSDVPLLGNSAGLWGLFAFGEVPWGSAIYPSNIRFLIPQEKQLGSYIIPTLIIKQGYSNFKIQGMSISYYNQSQEAGL